MRVRSASEVQSLDDELNLFEENEWDFMSVVDSQAQNYEYFNDIRDSDFEVKKFRIRDVIPYISCVIAVLALCTVWVIKVVNPFDDSDYQRVNGIQSVQQGTTVTYIEGGVEASAEELIAVSNSLGDYVGCLQGKRDYSVLDTRCVGSSKFAEKYYESTSGVQTMYDLNDCYARALREFASYYKVNRINSVVHKDDIYYCYAVVTYPSIYDVSEFVNMHNHSFVLKFQSGDNITEATLIKFLLEVIAENTLPVSTGETCIQMVNDHGQFKLKDDSFILNFCTDGYSVAVNQLSASLGGLLTSNRE